MISCRSSQTAWRQIQEMEYEFIGMLGIDSKTPQTS
jgi:hypothetical protein